MTPRRLPQLDVLRAVAILLVLCHHSNMSTAYPVLLPLENAGWMGVDLFFVLSGFLVSGLVIKEFQTYKSFDAWRFFVRRGFKIYPSYYLFLIVALPAVIWIPHLVTWNSFLIECCFMQNHFTNIWGHTWSLAIEEQFYILLCLGFYILTRFTKDPIKALLPIIVFCLIAPMIVRWVLFVQLDPAKTHAFYVKPLITATIARLDGLSFGVLLSLFYHTREQQLETFIMKWRWWLALCAMVLVAPCAIGGYKTFFLYVFGLAMLYVGCGLILMLALFCMPSRKDGVIGMAASIGFYSYSIYLWHKPFTAIFPLPFFAFVPEVAKVPLFFAGSILVGISMSKLVEVPALKLRDKLYPSRSSGV